MTADRTMFLIIAFNTRIIHIYVQNVAERFILQNLEVFREFNFTTIYTPLNLILVWLNL